jgi:hypothetical protein
MRQRAIFARAGSIILAAGLWAGLMACSGPAARAPGQSGTAAIALTGNAANSTLTIDNLLSFQVSGKGQQMSFRVQPGQHRVRVERNGATVVDRQVSILAGQTLEIPVP